MKEGKGKNLFIISTSFPFGVGEAWLENEVKVLANYFQKIYIIPQYQYTINKRKTPANVEIIDILYSVKQVNARKGLIKNLSLAVKILSEELMKNKNKFIVIKNIRKLNSILGQCFEKADLISSIIKEKFTTEYYFYSIWMNDGALILSILKSQGKIPFFIFRQHGFDLYNERRKDKYIPFRYFNFKMAEKIICASKDGYNYIKRKNIFPEKIHLSHLGVFDNGINPFDSRTFTMISCSNIISLKRVHLIPEVLKYINTELKWIHFGDGDLIEEVKRKVSHLSSNIRVEIRGQVSNESLLEFYKSTPVNLFIHLSETEGGVPVALQEAASFGIPLLGTEAGGIPEIVNDRTGMLVSLKIHPGEIASLINDFRNGEKNTSHFRGGVRKFWQENFDATINYRKFAEILME